MNTAVIQIKTEKNTKREAQKVLNELGLNFSSVIRAYLKELIRTKKVQFSVEEPSTYLLSAIQKSKENRKKSKASPVFKTGKSAVKWLEKQGV